jgi:hypothetical protein
MNPNTAALLIAFVRFMLSTEGQAMAVNDLFSPLPAAMITYNDNTLNSLTLPPGTPTYTTELASNTQVEVGAGPYVISGKRRSYAEYERTANVADVATLKTQVAALQAQARMALEAQNQTAFSLQMVQAETAQLQSQLQALQGCTIVCPAGTSNGRQLDEPLA